ncbi:MAG: ACP S-malonyltransferase [Spirochaetes bacterium]|nr:ACP S-malonyltransferase [Spirochaetota bacterium]
MSEKKLAYLFPGQGAQYTGMALDFLSSGSPAVKALFDTASGIMERDVKELLESDADTLKRTDISQVVISLANLCAAAYLGERGYKPAACAGFSLGEYSALATAGVISAEDCFRLVKARGQAMQKVAERLLQEAGGNADCAPGMAAVIGLAPKEVEALIESWRGEGFTGLYAANINSPSQLAVSGTAAALGEAEKRFKEAGAKRVIRLKVNTPFHSPLLEQAVELFRPALDAVKFGEPAIPVYSNVTSGTVASGEEAKKLAIEQITKPVRWLEEEASLAAAGFDACLEVGPGKVLCGLWKDAGSPIPVFPAGTVEDISKIAI